MGFFERLRAGLDKTRQNFTDKIAELVSNSEKIDEDFYPLVKVTFSSPITSSQD